MNHYLNFFTPAFFLCLAFVCSSASAGVHPWSGAYVSMVSGAVVLDAPDARGREALESGMPLAEGDRIVSGRGAFAEIAFRSGVTVWVDAETDVFVQRIFSAPVIVLGQGGVFVHVPEYFPDTLLVQAADPAVRLVMHPASLASVTTAGAFPAVIDLWSGQASVQASGGAVTLSSAQRVRLTGDAGFFIGDFITEPGTRFEVSSIARYRRAGAVGRSSVANRLQGIDALEHHGRWYYDADIGSRVWRPYVSSGWRPFYHGRWLYHPHGPYWMARDPWGSVTCHYGTWRRCRSGYWSWVPGTVFRPAAVRFFSCGRYAFWVPIGMSGAFGAGTIRVADYADYVVMCRLDNVYTETARRRTHPRHGMPASLEADRSGAPQSVQPRQVQELKPHLMPAPVPSQLRETVRMSRDAVYDFSERSARNPDRSRPLREISPPGQRRGSFQVVSGNRTRLHPDAQAQSGTTAVGAASPGVVYHAAPPTAALRRDTRRAIIPGRGIQQVRPVQPGSVRSESAALLSPSMHRPGTLRRGSADRFASSMPGLRSAPAGRQASAGPRSAASDSLTHNRPSSVLRSAPAHASQPRAQVQSRMRERFSPRTEPLLSR